MPLYTCIADDRTSTDQRAQIANEIMESHCGLTGAPPEFVHVFFNEYLGGNRKSDLRIVGNIRSGRSDELKAQLQADIVARVAQVLSTTPQRVEVALQEVPPQWAMEAGQVLPEPGTEEDWMTEHWEAKADEGDAERPAAAAQDGAE